MTNKKWCMCTKLEGVARDTKCTCTICGGIDAYGTSTERPVKYLKFIIKKHNEPDNLIHLNNIHNNKAIKYNDEIIRLTDEIIIQIMKNCRKEAKKLCEPNCFTYEITDIAVSLFNIGFVGDLDKRE